MRGQWTSGQQRQSLATRGLARNSTSPDSYGARSSIGGTMMAHKAMRLKLSGTLSREVSERRQVGDAEEMFAEKGAGGQPWWRNVGMEEGL